jgi:hypothetical protein
MRRNDDRVKMTKGECVKFASCETVVELLKEAGWKAEGEKKADTVDRDVLKSKATELGIDYPKNIKTDKLIELIAEKE